MSEASIDNAAHPAAGLPPAAPVPAPPAPQSTTEQSTTPTAPGVLRRLWARTWPGRIALLEARLAVLEDRMEGLVVCPSCGTVMVSGHPGTRRVEMPDGTHFELCKWDHSRVKLNAMSAQKKGARA